MVAALRLAVSDLMIAVDLGAAVLLIGFMFISLAAGVQITMVAEFGELLVLDQLLRRHNRAKRA